VNVLREPLPAAFHVAVHPPLGVPFSLPKTPRAQRKIESCWCSVRRLSPSAWPLSLHPLFSYGAAGATLREVSSPLSSHAKTPRAQRKIEWWCCCVRPLSVTARPISLHPLFSYGAAGATLREASSVPSFLAKTLRAQRKIEWWSCCVRPLSVTARPLSLQPLFSYGAAGATLREVSSLPSSLPETQSIFFM